MNMKLTNGLLGAVCTYAISFIKVFKNKRT